MKTRYFKGFVLTISIVVLSGCGLITKKYENPTLTDEQQKGLYRDHQSQDTTNLTDVKWQDFFTDEHLKNLIQEGLDRNYDLQNAILQIASAENTLKQAKQQFAPSLDFTPQVTYNKSSKNALNFPSNVNINLQTTTVSLGFSTSWEIEIWGKLTAAKRSSQAAWMKSIASQNAVKTALIATIAESYYTLLSLDKQLEITEETIKIREKSVEAIKALKESGSLNGADVVQAESNLYAAQVTLPDLKRSIRELENALCVLTAKPLQAIERSKFDAQSFAIDMKIGVPAQLLANRPDVTAAELGFRQAFEVTNVARASFYPSLRLTAGSGGISALTTRTLLDPTSIFVNLVGGLVQPIFQRGVLKTNLRNAKIAQQQAWNTFEKTLLTAGQEVTDALYAFDMAKEKQATRVKQIEALQKAVEFRTNLLQYSSTTNYTDVLTSEQSLITAQLASVNDQLQEFKAMIALYRSLGGGWK
ncbi:MAG: efflux transporter outer membrane subunit [Crocinitomicaceae bacterium]|nr:efflux transporter outer membrane subunit [Crocinitomicaceae bacterium]